MTEHTLEQVNINLTGGDVSAVDVMMKEDGFDNRSAFMRRLVRQEVMRRAKVIGTIDSATGKITMQGKRIIAVQHADGSLEVEQ